MISESRPRIAEVSSSNYGEPQEERDGSSRATHDFPRDRTLFIGNLRPTMPERALLAFFQPSVVKTTIQSGQEEDRAHVIFRSNTEAQKAFKSLHGRILQGRKVWLRFLETSSFSQNTEEMARKDHITGDHKSKNARSRSSKRTYSQENQDGEPNAANKRRKEMQLSSKPDLSVEPGSSETMQRQLPVNQKSTDKRSNTLDSIGKKQKRKSKKIKLGTLRLHEKGNPLTENQAAAS
jgi:RNA recognition motif-containing protein